MLVLSILTIFGLFQQSSAEIPVIECGDDNDEAATLVPDGFLILQSKNYPSNSINQNVFNCQQRFQRSDDKSGTWFVLLIGRIRYFDIAGISLDDSDYDNDRFVWNRNMSLWFSYFASSPKLELNIYDDIYQFGFEKWAGFQAFVYAPGYQANNSCPFNGASLNLNSIGDIYPIASQFGNVPSKTAIRCLWKFSIALGLKLKLPIRQFQFSNAERLILSIDNQTSVSIDKIGVQYFEGTHFELIYQKDESSEGSLGFGGIVTVVEMSPQILRECPLYNYNVTSGYATNQECSVALNGFPNYIAYGHGWTEKGVDTLTLSASNFEPRDITTANHITDAKATNAVARFVSDGNLVSVGLKTTVAELSCKCVKSIEVNCKSADSDYQAIMVQAAGGHYCPDMFCSFELYTMVGDCIHSPILLIAYIELRPNTSDTVKVYNNGQLLHTITPTSPRHHPILQPNTTTKLEVQSDPSLFGILKAPKVVFQPTLLSDCTSTTVNLTPENFTHSLNLMYSHNQQIYTVTAPEGYILEMFMAEEVVNSWTQYFHKPMEVYDSNTTLNFVNTFDNLPLHPVYQQLRSYTSTSGSLTLFTYYPVRFVEKQLFAPYITVFYRLRELHTPNCLTENVVMAYNKTITATASENGSCILTVLNWNSETLDQTMFWNFKTDSSENVKLIFGTDFNRNYLKFNQQTASDFPKLFLFGISFSLIIPKGATINLKAVISTIPSTPNSNGYDHMGLTQGIFTSKSFANVPINQTADIQSKLVPPHSTCNVTIKFLDLSLNGSFVLVFDGQKMPAKLNDTFTFSTDSEATRLYFVLTEPLFNYKGYVINYVIISRGESYLFWGLLAGGLFFMVLMFGVAGFWFYRRRKQRLLLRKFRRILEQSSKQLGFSINKNKHCKRTKMYVDPKRLSIDLNDKLGEGFSAMIFQAFLKEEAPIHVIEQSITTSKYTNCQAAVKIPKKYTTTVEIKKFTRELEVLIQIGVNPHIITCLGWSIFENSPVLITELAQGNLLSYVKILNLDDFPILKAYSWLWQLSRALEYLAELKIIHRDLACRNVLMLDNDHVKLSDFGLCCVSNDLNVYQDSIPKYLPLRWSALEALITGIFSGKSDIWSFGILAWEIFACGELPYSELTEEEVLDFLKNGGRLEKLDQIPDEIYFLMTQCWQENPDDRPNAVEVGKYISRLIRKDDEDSGYIVVKNYDS